MGTVWGNWIHKLTHRSICIFEWGDVQTTTKARAIGIDMSRHTNNETEVMLLSLDTETQSL